MHELLLGGIAVASFVAGLIFLRYWLSTRDRFFLLFCASFWIEAANRASAGLADAGAEGSPYFQVRLLSFLLIVAAIVDKNLRR